MVENVTGRDGVTLGTMLSGPMAIADQRGLVQPTGSDWSLDWWVGADDRWHLPAREVNVRQARLGDGPVLETAMRIPGGDAVHRCWAVEDGGGAVVIEVENRSMVPMAVAFAVRPVGLLGVGRIGEARLEGNTIYVDGAAAVVLGKKPGLLARGGRIRDSVHDVVEGASIAPTVESVTDPDGMAALSVVVPVPHQTAVRCVVLRDPGRADSVEVNELATVEQVVAGWDRHLESGVSIVLPDALLTAAFLAAVARLLVAADERGVPSPSGATDWGIDAEAEVLRALGRLGRREVQTVLAQRWHDAPPGRGDGPLVGLVASVGAALGDDRLFDEYLSLLLPLADESYAAGSRGRSDVAAALRRLGHVDAADQFLAKGASEVADAAAGTPPVDGVDDATAATPRGLLDVVETARSVARDLGLGPIDARLAWLVEAGGDVRSWPDAVHPRLGRGGGGAIDSPSAAAALVDLVVGLVVDDRGPDQLRLLPHVPVGWLGQPIDVSDLATSAGVLSYAVRWHGERPALLWELVPHENGPVVLSCPGLDESWSSTEPAGEVLLEAPPSAPTAPAEGGSFS